MTIQAAPSARQPDTRLATPWGGHQAQPEHAFGAPASNTDHLYGGSHHHHGHHSMAAASALHSEVTGTSDGGMLDPSKIQVGKVVTAEEQASAPGGMSNKEALDQSLIGGGSPALIMARAMVAFFGGPVAAEQFDGLILNGLRSVAPHGDADPADDPNTNPAGPTPSPSPSLPPPDVQPPTNQDPNGILFGPDATGPQREDAIQGSRFGDCYFIATLSAYAANQPKVITDAIQCNPDGSYSVTLYQKDANGMPEKKVIPVTLEDLQENINIGGAGESIVSNPDPTKNGAAWPAVIEVAYAKLRAEQLGFPNDILKGYYYSGDPKNPTAPHGIANGGLPPEVEFALTGTTGETVDADQLTPDELAKKIKDALGSGQGVELGAFEEELGPDGKPLSDGLSDNHAYEVVALRQTAEGIVVDVRNPWGNNIAAYDPTSEGIYDTEVSVVTVALSTIQATGNDEFYIDPAAPKPSTTQSVPQRTLALATFGYPVLSHVQAQSLAQAWA